MVAIACAAGAALGTGGEASNAAVAMRPDRVELRSGEVIDGRVVAIEPSGLLWRRDAVGATPVAPGGASGANTAGEAGSTVRFAWDRVAAVEADPSTMENRELAVWLDRGERLWRARMRLARGDAGMAEEAIGPQWNIESLDGETGAVAALVQTQLALSKADGPGAWRSWFEAARLRRQGFREPSLQSWIEPSASGAMIVRPLFDDGFLLSPSLPPFAFNDSERASLLDALDAFDPRGDDGLGQLRQAVAAVVDPSRGAPAAPVPAAAAARAGDAGNEELHRAIELLRALRDARSSNAAERQKARETLAGQRRRLPEWAEAWSRFAVGSGLLLDGTPESSIAAQIELMHLPARFAVTQPALAAKALEISTATSRADGRAAEAQRFDAIRQGLLGTP